MANTINFILTNAALELIPKILNGKTLNFTRMAVGDGFCYTEAEAMALTTLVNEVLSLNITKKEIENISKVKITSAFTSSDLEKEFYYREVGLFAQDPDTGQEVLYAYGNRNDAAEFITPNGASSVSKKLIFIVLVGNSANVTFSINADIYALQSDMENVQENLKQFENGKANKDLSNTGMITNCLLEVPQRIKYELTDGVLTIKAGTVLIVPYGIVDLSATYTVGSSFLNSNYKVIYTQYDSDNKFFVWVELQEDLIHTIQGILTESAMEFILPEMNWATDWGLESILSGETPPTGNRFFYNTQTNYVEWYDENEITHLGFSLPIIITNKENGIPTSIKQVFNGMGFIGSHFWIDKDVKGLIPDGRNIDGTLKSEIMTLPSIILGNATADGVFSIYITSSSIGMCRYYRSDGEPVANGYIVWYDPTNNMMYTKADDNAEWIKEKTLIFGQCECQSSRFVSASINKPFNIVNYNDFANKIHQLEARLSLLEANQNI